MELRHLRWFGAVADLRSFRKAAERMGLTQPPLSRGIQALEEELGVRLLNRSRNHVELTPVGEEFLSSTRAALEALERAVEGAKGRAEITGKVRLSVVLPEYLQAGPLAQGLAAYRQAYPAVEVTIVPNLIRKIVGEVASGKADIGIAFTPLEGPVEALEVRVILHDQPVLALPGSLGPLPEGPVKLAQVRRLPLVLFPRRAMPDKYDEILGYFARAGEAGKRVQHVSPSLKEALESVGRGEAVSVVPRQAAAVHQKAGFLLRPIQGVGGLWNVVLLTRRELRPAAQKLAERLVEALS